MAIKKQAVNSNSSFVKADAWLRIRVLQKNKDGSLATDENGKPIKRYIHKDIPVYKGRNDVLDVLIQGSMANPSRVYDCTMTINVVDSEDNEDVSEDMF